jgi:hypothetical protein
MVGVVTPGREKFPARRGGFPRHYFLIVLGGKVRR